MKLLKLMIQGYLIGRNDLQAACIWLHKVRSIRLNVQAHITIMVLYGSVWAGMGVANKDFLLSTVSLVGTDYFVAISLRAGSIVGFTARL